MTDEHTPEELQEYEKSLNLDYESYYRTPEQVIEDLSSMQDVSSKSIKESFYKVRYNDEPTEEVYNMHHDTAGNLHYIGVRSGKHIITLIQLLRTIKGIK